MASENAPTAGSVLGLELAKPLTDADIEGDRSAKVFAELWLKL